MATNVNKAFTDLEQSKKLAEILPIESADMFWQSNLNSSDRQYLLNMGEKEYFNIEMNLEHCSIGDYDIPCWSLAALFNYLKSKNKFPDIKELSDGRFKLTTFIWDGKKSFQVFIADNLVDACYKLILKLHECEML